MSNLDLAYDHVVRANYAVSDTLSARAHFRLAADALRRAKAFDLARFAEHELDRAIDAPYSESLLEAIDRRAMGRMMKVAI